MVGDRYYDIQSGEGNRCLVVGASYGYAKPGELDDAGHNIARLAEILELVVREPEERATR